MVILLHTKVRYLFGHKAFTSSGFRFGMPTASGFSMGKVDTDDDFSMDHPTDKLC